VKSMSLKLNKCSYKKSILFIALLFIFLSLFSSVSCANPNDIDLAHIYAPILYFKKGESCFPVNVSYHLDNSEYYCFPDGASNCFYDNKYGTIYDSGVINHYQSVMNKYGYMMYYRVYYDFLSDATVIQYWMFYAFNNGELNQHEGDWEMVQVVIPSNDTKWVAYSQHYGGQMAKWDQVEREGDNIKVYVALGSHANYFRSYSGKLGIANDIVSDDGIILRSNDYVLEPLEDQDWLDFAGKWGEGGEDINETAGASILGQTGPEGPKYRDGGYMWFNPILWGNSLPQVNDTSYLLEWLFYNFVLLFVLITLASLSIAGFLIYRRHRKYGLGPKVLSMLYIDGLNFKSIGNLLCIVGIIVAILGLFNPWYEVSYNLSGVGIGKAYETSGITDLIKIDGIDGIQISIPGQSGPTPVGTISLPFSLVIGLSLLFLIIAAIGVSHSKKLGSKYLWRGIRLLIPIILLIVVILTICGIMSAEAEADNNESVKTIFDSIFSSPLGHKDTFLILYDEKVVPLQLQWGLSLGALLLLISGIIIPIAGIFEIMANTQFFAIKSSIKNNVKTHISVQDASFIEPQQPIAQQSSSSDLHDSSSDISNTNFCMQCGAIVEPMAKSCTECGATLKRKS